MDTAASGIGIDTSPHTNESRVGSHHHQVPDAAARFLAHPVTPGAVMPPRVRIAMHGQIKVMGFWLPFRAEEILDRRSGFSWQATVGGGLLHATDDYDFELGLS